MQTDLKFASNLRIAVLLVGVVIGFTIPANGADGRSFRQAVFPIYNSKSPRAIAVVRAEESFRDYLQKGFFKIGVFPIRVVKNLEIELLQPEAAKEALAKAARHLSDRGRLQGFDVEKFSLAAKPGKGGGFRLYAARITHLRGGAWKLTQGHFQQGDVRHEFASAKLLLKSDTPELVLPDQTHFKLTVQKQTKQP